MTPHKCPVCEGHQTVPPGIYTDQPIDSPRLQCRTCSGKGVLWAPDASDTRLASRMPTIAPPLNPRNPFDYPPYQPRTITMNEGACRYGLTDIRVS